ncbi:hypothetical protein [Prosthecobacter sp.]
MKYFRLVALLALPLSLTSCGTLFGLLGSGPVRMMDELGSSLMGMLGDAESGSPKSIEERAKKVQDNGMYAGRGAPVGVISSRQSTASR